MKVRHQIVGAFVAVTLLGLFACWDGDAQAPTEVSDTPRSQFSVLPANALGAQIRNSPEWKKAEWVGQLHTAMLKDVMQQRGRLRAMDRSARCKAILALAEKYTAQIQRDQQALKGRNATTVASRAVRSTDLCKSTPMSLAGPTAALLAMLQYSEEDGEPVTGAFEPYVAEIQAAVDWGYSPADIANTVNSVLSRAAGIPYPDLEVVYSSASLALESSYYWYDYESGGGFAGEQPLVMSLFSGSSFMKSWKGGAVADAIGCGAGVADKWFLGGAGPIGWKVLAGACLIWGGSASLAYALT